MYLRGTFITQFGRVSNVSKEDWGLVTSLRTWYEDFIKVEFSITTPKWLEKPLDPGTLRVLSNGYQVLIDTNDYFRTLNLDAHLKS